MYDSFPRTSGTSLWLTISITELLLLPFATFYTPKSHFIGREILLITSGLFHCINLLVLSFIAPKNVHFEKGSIKWNISTQYHARRQYQND